MKYKTTIKLFFSALMCFTTVEDGNPFTERSTRRGFIRKVFGILAVQFIFTFGLIFATTYIDDVNDYFRGAVYWVYISMGVNLVVFIGFGCCGYIFRRCPLSAIAIVLLTVTMTFTACVISSRYDELLVLQAIGSVAAVFTALLLFALFIPVDLTMCWMVALGLSVVIMITAIVGLFVHDKIIWIVVCSLGVCAVTISMIVDMQMIIGGRHIRYQFDEEDYAFAAICLYTDVVTMFIYILQLLGLGNC